MTQSQFARADHSIERLLAACSDGVEGYRRAAAEVRSPELHAVLNRNAVEREEITSVLTNLLVELGRKPEHRGTLAGAAHRGWLGALGVTHADDAIIRECKRGERATISAFADALAQDLPRSIRQRVHAQLERILAALERLAMTEGPQGTGEA